MKTRIKNYVAVALSVVFIFITTIASANDGEKNPPVAQLKYIGNIKNQPVFQLDLNTDKENDFLISIKDEYGEPLYSERVKTKNFTRKFQLDTDNLGDAVLRVEVRTGDKKPEVFMINRSSRFVEETSISKL